MRHTLVAFVLMLSANTVFCQRLHIDTANKARIELNTPKSDFKTGCNILLGSIAPTFTGVGLLGASYFFKGETANSMKAGGIGCLGMAAIVKATGIMYLVRGGKRSRQKTVPRDI